MIPNSLRIALAAGMLGGILTAVVLADLRAGQEVRHVDGASLVILTDKEDYERGEPVKISVLNSGGTNITFATSVHVMKIIGLAGMPIYPGVGTDEEILLEPGGRIEVTWDQTRFDGERVFDGVYKISSVGRVGDDDLHENIEATRIINIYGMDLTFGS